MIDELLVHISAPTTRQGDEQYRSLAEEYLEFEPHSPQRSSSRQIDISNQPVSSRLDNAASPDHRDSFRGTADTSILSASKDSYGSFPSYPSSGGLKTSMPAVDRWEQDVEDDLPPTSSQIPEPENMHNNRTWRRTLRSSSTKGRVSDKQFYESSDIDVGFIEDTQLGAAVIQSQYQDSNFMQLGGASENDTNEGRIQNDTIGASVAATPGTEGSSLQRRRSKRLKVASSVAKTPVSAASSAFPTLEEPAGSGNTLRSSLLPPKRKIDKHEDIDFSQFPPPIDFTKVASIVYPPEPYISTAQPGTLPSQITPYLAMLKQRLPTQFQPIKRLKKPKPDDRGYWLIDCFQWSTESQKLFWSDISSQVLNGCLGWGVMLFREGGTSFKLGKVKLYCWGEIVEHTWIVLLLASEGRTRQSGLKWIDADGDSAFVMS